LSSIFSPFRFSVVPTASSRVAVPRPETSRLSTGRKMKWVTYGVVPFLAIGSAAMEAEAHKIKRQLRTPTFHI
jgi:hypothetical protein